MADITFYKNIPFAPDGSFTMDFLTAGGAFSEATRTSYLEGSSRFYTSIALGDSVYIRDNAPFRVPYNIDALRNAGVNYFRFRNVVPDVTPAVYSRYYYGFIDKMTLAAADTTEIEWHIDPLQTYLSEIYSEPYQQKIERCHQDRFNSSMQPLFNTLPDISSGSKRNKLIKKIVSGDIGYCVLICSDQLESNSFDSSTRVAPPYLVQNCQNSFYYYIFPLFKNPSAHTNDNFVGGGWALYYCGMYKDSAIISDSMLFKNAAPKVVGMFYSPIPPVHISWTRSSRAGGGYTYTLSSTDEVEAVDGAVGPGSAGQLFKTLRVKNTTSIFLTTLTTSGFTGLRNTTIISDNVNISSPYSYNTARNPLRETKLYTSPYSIIYFTDYASDSKEIRNELINDDSTMSASASFSLVGMPTIWARFSNYNGSIDGINDFKNSSSNEMPLMSDSYADYFSRKRAAIAGSIISAAASFTSGVIGKRPIAAVNNASSIIGSQLTSSIDAMLAPDPVKSTSNDITPTFSRGYNDFIYYYQMPVNAVELCDFWALYGYPYDKPAKLSDVINTRYRFNYVKTGGARLPSVTYTEHKKALEALLDGGVTFWHNHAGTFAAIGDYSKENAEMSLL